MQKGDAHVGKVPAASIRSAELLKVQESMQEAVRAQDFETAARLRDRIQELRNSRSAVAPAGRTSES